MCVCPQRRSLASAASNRANVLIIIYCCPVNNYSPLYCFVIQCFISIFTKGACLILCGLRSALPLARARKPNNHIAQGSALGIIVYIMNNAPCKGNTLIIRLLPLQGVWFVCVFNPRRCLGLCASAPSGRTACNFCHTLLLFFCKDTIFSCKPQLQTMQISYSETSTKIFILENRKPEIERF